MTSPYSAPSCSVEPDQCGSEGKGVNKIIAYLSRVRKDTRKAQIINIIILIVVVGIAWVIWTERKSKQALDKDSLETGVA